MSELTFGNADAVSKSFCEPLISIDGLIADAEIGSWEGHMPQMGKVSRKKIKQK